MNLLVTSQQDYQQRQSCYSLRMISPASQHSRKLCPMKLKRSDSQKFTPADGECGFHSVLDGYNNLHTDGLSLFERTLSGENTLLVRRMVIQGRKMELKKQESLGSNELMMVMQGMSDHYLEKICRKGEFVDHITLQIIIIYIHPRSATKHIVLPGGEFGSQEKSINKPIYVAFYDEVCFGTGHYQAIAPLQM